MALHILRSVIIRLGHDYGFLWTPRSSKLINREIFEALFKHLLVVSIQVELVRPQLVNI